MHNIYLVGFMGTGKTSVGRKVAQRKGFPFIDIDEIIEQRQGCAIADIFARRGEAYFRGLERTTLGEVAGRDKQVVSCGGGIVLDPENIVLMKQTGTMVCLTARADVILKRTAGYAHRPLLNVGDPQRAIEELLSARAFCYAQADVTIDTSEVSIDEAADKVFEGISQLRKEQ